MLPTLCEKEASIYSNIAACYKQCQMTKDEIKTCGLVVDMEDMIKDKNIIVKAYLRRGLAYE